MKLAAILALVVAVMLGGWALNDYRNNEDVRKDFERQGVTALGFRTDSGENVQLDVRKMTAYNERHDVKVGGLSIVSFVASAVLFSRRKRVVA
jgi:hypothetical protein